MKLCLHDCTSEGWPAGQVVLAAIIHALKKLGSDCPHISLSTWSDKPRDSLKSLASSADSIVELPAGKESPASVGSVLVKNGVDCFFSIPTATALTVSVPRICWIYDFQHLHHPEYFSSGEAAHRSSLFRRNAETAGRIFVYSSAVERDLVTFAPDLAAKVKNIRLGPHSPSEAWTSDETALQEYKLPPKFFFMPNQLQPHKNHERVLAALRLLRDRGCAVSVLCTGSIPERDRPRRDALTRRAAELGVQDLVVLLGFVPASAYFQLMRQCVALLNPSLFEGFGLGVSEAGYLARQVVVSDIPVFREHEIPGALYFNPEDPAAMAACMEKAMALPGTDTVDFERYATAQRRFGLEFLHMVNEVVRKPS